jgi:uncharacterized membrane protein SpoIIM required for sporulation
MAKFPNMDPLDKQILWINIAGITIAAVLVGLFFALNGIGIVDFLAFLTGISPWPDTLPDR